MALAAIGFIPRTLIPVHMRDSVWRSLSNL